MEQHRHQQLGRRGITQSTDHRAESSLADYFALLEDMAGASAQEIFASRELAPLRRELEAMGCTREELEEGGILREGGGRGGRSSREERHGQGERSRQGGAGSRYPGDGPGGFETGGGGRDRAAAGDRAPRRSGYGDGTRHEPGGFGSCGEGRDRDRAAAGHRAPRRSSHNRGSRYEAGGMGHHGEHGQEFGGGQGRRYGMGGHSEDDHSDYENGTVSDDEWI